MDYSDLIGFGVMIAAVALLVLYTNARMQAFGSDLERGSQSDREEWERIVERWGRE